MSKKLILCLSLLIGCFASQATTLKLPIKSYYIPGLVDTAESGLFIEVLRLIEQEQGLGFEVSLSPTKRVQLDFAAGSIFGYFPELEENRPKQGNCRTDAFMQKQIVAFVRKGDDIITEVTSLEGKTVGGVTGYSYGLDIINNPNINLELVHDDKINIKKLLSGRIDAIIGDIHSTVNGLKETNTYDKVDFDGKKPVSYLDVFFLFQDTQDGVEACEIVSKGIEKLRAKGELLTRFGYQ